MEYGYYMPADVCSYCPYMTGVYTVQNTDTENGQQDAVKKVGDKEVTYDKSQHRILPLLTIPLLFAAAGPGPFYGPRPFWGPPPFFYNYWYYYR